MTSHFQLLQLLLLLSNPLRQVEAATSAWHPVRIEETWFTQNSTNFGQHKTESVIICAAVVAQKYWGNLFCFQEGNCRFNDVIVPHSFEETRPGNVIDCKARTPPNTCLPPYQQVTDVGCISILTSTYTFSDARSLCQQQGGDLVTPESFSALVQYLETHVEDSDDSHYWVGAQVSTGWHDGRPVEDSELAPGEPNGTGDCYRMMGPEDLLLGDKQCDTKYSAICER
ncbi:uncharacterized protein [Palaemon carinicauda]|uniref:uncharacterized protein n=1 Tax=Palaemon carinicauda TaxID=392227 RepID=UPI0035B5BF8B